MRSVALPALLILFSSAAVAQTVDQVSVVDGGFVFNVGRSAMAQSFTVGLSGLMVQVEVEISNFDESPTEDMTFSIVRAPGLVPSTAPADELFSTTVLAADVPASRTSVLIDVFVPVAVDDQLAWVMDAPEDPDTGFNTWSVYAQTGNPYTRGAASRFPGDAREEDLGFRTFVDETFQPFQPVPTLSSIGVAALAAVLLLLGMIALRTASARRRSQ